ncbi:endospore germination permease [Haloimpatiens sp. FM7330]|uniref:GerAB/ArcD/ProY family transporter n=1 Tax=Haloimpatiens sp. FM7330 TaxID=3298610 RepID=UPI00363B9246
MKEYITNKQFAFILFGAIVGYGAIALPKNVAQKGESGGWVSIILASFIACAITYMNVYLSYIHQNQTICEYSRILTGKIITNIFIIIYIIYFFIFSTMLTRSASEVIKLSILIKTPVWALCLMFFLVVYYAVFKGFKCIVRTCEIYGIITIAAAIIIHFSIMTQGKIVNIRPIFEVSEIPLYIKSVISLITPFLGMEVLLCIPVNRTYNKGIFKYIILMMLFIGVLYVLIVESCISVIGIDDIIHYEDALVATIKRVRIPYLEFLERIDGIFIISWVMSVFCTIVLYAYGTVFFIEKCFTKVNHKFVIIIVMSLSFIVSQIPKTFEGVQKIIKYSGYYFGLIAAVLIPAILLIITKVKKYDKKI